MILGLIPARLNSQRLPGKPLIKIDGFPLIIHVLKRSLLCKNLDKVPFFLPRVGIDRKLPLANSNSRTFELSKTIIRK